jgi:hypothetical protein
MTTITLPPDLDGRIQDEAMRRGTTPELLALDGLRQLFPVSRSTPSDNGGTLLDFLGPFAGAIDGSSEPLSENCGKKFTEALAEKNRRARP